MPSSAWDNTLTFTYSMQNTGTVPPSNASVIYFHRRDLATLSSDLYPYTPLFRSETWTYTKTATALADQQTNAGSVTGRDPNTGATVTDDNPANYFGVPPG